MARAEDREVAAREIRRQVEAEVELKLVDGLGVAENRMKMALADSAARAADTLKEAVAAARAKAAPTKPEAPVRKMRIGRADD